MQGVNFNLKHINTHCHSFGEVLGNLLNVSLWLGFWTDLVWHEPCPQLHLFIVVVVVVVVVIILQLSQFFPLCPPLSSTAPTPSGSPHPVVHVFGSFIHVCCLVPSSSFHHSHPLPSGLCQSVPCIHASGSVLLVSLFCSLNSCDKWDHMVFILNCLAYFSALILFSSIHTVGKGRSSFFLSAA